MSELIPEGTYDAVAVKRNDDQGVSAYVRWSLTQKEKKQVSAFFRILGVDGNIQAPWYGSFSNTTLGDSNKTVAERTVESLRYMGLKGDDLMAVETQELDQIVSVTVEHNEYEAKDGSTKVGLRIGWVNAPGGGIVKIARPMSDNDKRKFAAVMRNSVAKVAEVDGERHAVQATEAPSNGANGAQNGAASAQPTSSGDWGGGPPQEEAPPPFDDDIPFIDIVERAIGCDHQPGRRAV